MPPRKASGRTRLPANNRRRYQSVPGTARRYLDTNTGETISYRQWYSRIHGQTREQATARRLGFASPREQRAHERERGTLVSRGGGNLRPYRPGASVTQRRRGDLAETWAMNELDHGRPIPTVRTGKRRGLPNRAWAARQPEFIELEAELAVASRAAREARTEQERAALRGPGSDLERVLVALGRRPPNFRDAMGFIPVGDSPRGTARAYQDVLRMRSSLPDVGVNQAIHEQLNLPFNQGIEVL